MSKLLLVFKPRQGSDHCINRVRKCLYAHREGLSVRHEEIFIVNIEDEGAVRGHDIRLQQLRSSIRRQCGRRCVEAGYRPCIYGLKVDRSSEHGIFIDVHDDESSARGITRIIPYGYVE